MATKWGEHKRVENEGIIYVQSVLNRTGCVFNKVDGSNDIGIDGYIEFTQANQAIGLCIAVQIKSGNSFQHKSKKLAVVQSDKAHFTYWSAHTLPVVCIVYVPEDETAYWFDITAYLKTNASILENGPYALKIDKASVFNTKSHELFFQHFDAYRERFNKDWNFGRSLKGLSNHKPQHEREDALRSLFSFHRNQEESWFYLIQQFRFEEDRYITQGLLHYMRLLVSHGDILWHKDNIIEDEIRKFGRDLIKRYYGFSEVHTLLTFIDENGISRGSWGQNVYPLLDLVQNKSKILREIILSSTTSEDVRFWAAVIIINDYQYADDIDGAANFAQSMLTNFPESDNVERFQLIKETIRDSGWVDFQG